MLRRAIRALLRPFRRAGGAPRVRPSPDGVHFPLPGLGELDLKLHDTGDPWISGMIRQGHPMDPKVLAVLRAFIRPGDTFLDLGGNIGWFTLIGSRLVGPRGKVFAVEPDPANAAVLRENIRRNGCANTTLFEVAAGASESTARLYRSAENAGDHQMAATSDRTDWVDVPVRRLDTLMTGDHARVDVLKMDTQGSEVAALSGMGALLAANPSMRMVLEFWPYGLAQVGGSTEKLVELLADPPRRFWLMDHLGQILPVTPADLVVLSRTTYAPDTRLHGDIVVVAAGDEAAIRRIRAMETRRSV